MAANDAARPRVPSSLHEGSTLLHEHGLTALFMAVSAPNDPTATDNGWAYFWRGYAAQFEDLGLARIEWLKAEEHFARAGDQTGLDLVACGLVQGVQLDNQSFDGYAAREERASRLRDLPGAPALDLFVVATRIIIASLRCEFGVAFASDLERAFSALGSEIDANVTLRCACAALKGIGRAFERARADDFLLASERVASRPEVTDYGRALWHLFSALSRWYDVSICQRTREQLDAVERHAHGTVGRRLMARAQIMRALIALNADDAPTADANLNAAHKLLDPEYSQDYALFHLLRARHALAIGAFDQSLAHATVSLQKCEAMQAPAAEIVPILMTMASAQAALGRYDEALAAFVRSGEMSDGVQANPCHVHARLVHALSDMREGALGEARAELLAAFALARNVDLTHFFRALPVLAAKVCGAALDLDADLPFVQKVIAARRLSCPDIGISRWPWALRLKTLGAFVIERDDVPLKPARKAPKRLIDLLRFVASLGGRHVDAARAAATLWPEADGDFGRDALKAMLHRVRVLLGADALQVRDGQISFDEKTVWLDTWALEHVAARIELLAGSGLANDRGSPDGELALRRLQLLTLYRGHFLGEGEVPAWALPMRDRLRARFVRSVEMLGQRLERLGRQDEAIHLYRAALEQDNLAEELYQRLIECHLARGEHAQALGAYRRCRELLSIVLGLRPSARTEALAARIAAH